MEAISTSDRGFVREREEASIREFVESVAFHGRVLDFGCGEQPYRDHVESCGPDVDYVGHDRPHYPGSTVSSPVGPDRPLLRFWDMILCTQVLQYLDDPAAVLAWFAIALRPSRGTLVLTYDTCWDDFEPGDLWRFTHEGIGRLLVRAGFEILRHDRRGYIEVPRFRFPLGGGVTAQVRT